MNEQLAVRVALPEDAEKILEVYAPYVRKTAITFEYDVPTPDAFRGRIENTLKRYPYLVAERGEEILGYAYIGPFVGRSAYDWAAETSIYLREDMKKLGIGRRLYQAIENVAKAQNILNLNACIGYPEADDEYLTKNSAQFHAHLGYEMVGEFHRCGYKFGKWYNMVWMEKMIGEHDPVPKPFRPFPEIEPETLASLGVLPPRRTGSASV